MPQYASQAARARQAYAEDPKATPATVSTELQSQGLSYQEATTIAEELRLEQMADRYGGTGAAQQLRALGVDLATVGRDVVQSACFTLSHYTWRGHDEPTTKEARIDQFLQSGAGHGGEVLRRDLAMLEQIAAVGDLSPQGRFKLDTQAVTANQRIDFIATALGVERGLLEAAVRDTTITPGRADQLIESQYAALLPPDTGFDRAANNLTLVTQDEFLGLYDSARDQGDGLIRRALKKLARRFENRRIPDLLPPVVVDGKTTIPMDSAHFGAGAALTEGLRFYQHPAAEQVLGSSVAQLVREHLAEMVNTQFDPAYTARLDQMKAQGRDEIPWFRKDVVAPRSVIHHIAWDLQGAVGEDALAAGFFKDPAALKARLEQVYGPGSVERMDELLGEMLQAPDALDAHQVNKKLDAFMDQAPARAQALPGVPAFAIGRDAQEIAQLAGAVARRLDTSPDDGAAAVQLALETAPQPSQLAAGILTGLGAKASQLPRQALALLAGALTERPIFTLLATKPDPSATDIVMSATKRTYDRGDPPAPDPAALAALDQALAPLRDQARGELATKAVLRRDSDADHAQLLGGALQKALAPYTDGGRVEQAVQAAFVDAKQCSITDLLWAKIDPSEHPSLRYHLQQGVDGGAQVVVGREDDIAYSTSAALELAQHPDFAAAFPPTVAAKLRDNLQMHLGELDAADMSLRAVAGYVDMNPDYRSATFMVWMTLEAAFEAALRKEGLAPDSTELQTAQAQEWAKLVIGGDVGRLQRALDDAVGPGTYQRMTDLLSSDHWFTPDTVEQLRTIALEVRKGWRP